MNMFYIKKRENKQIEISKYLMMKDLQLHYGVEEFVE